jgi:hypothetical protein
VPHCELNFFPLIDALLGNAFSSSANDAALNLDRVHYSNQYRDISVLAYNTTGYRSYELLFAQRLA